MVLYHSVSLFLDMEAYALMIRDQLLREFSISYCETTKLIDEELVDYKYMNYMMYVSYSYIFL